MAYDLQIGAATVYMEASGETYEAQRAVAHILVNRLKDGRWGKTLAAVCLRAEQFSSWNTSDPNRQRFAAVDRGDPLLKQIEVYVEDAMSGTDTDPTGGALYYFNPTLARPYWAAHFVKTVDIGQQSFYKEP